MSGNIYKIRDDGSVVKTSISLTKKYTVRDLDVMGPNHCPVKLWDAQY